MTTGTRGKVPRRLQRRLISPLLRRYWRLTRGLTLGAQGIIIDDAERVLLVRHGYRPGWWFPGGGVERGETLERALARELEEEAGVILEGAPELFGVFANFRSFPGDHIAVYVIRQWRQPVPPTPNVEIAETGFYARDALPEGTHAGVRRRLAELFEGAARSPDW